MQLTITVMATCAPEPSPPLSAADLGNIAHAIGTAAMGELAGHSTHWKVEAVVEQTVASWRNTGPSS